MNLFRYLAVCAVVLFGLTLAEDAKKEQAQSETKYIAILIWATDGSKPDDPHLKDVDEHFRGKLKKIFKWQNYYEVNRQTFTLKNGEKNKMVKLSEKCELKLDQSEQEGMAVELIGEGKPMKKVKQAMPLTDWLVVGGDDKNATAWFVVIKPE
jgi:hypothetical protein